MQTDVVVNCAGVWDPEIGTMVGIDISGQPWQGQFWVTEKTEKIAKRKIMESGYFMAKFGFSNYQWDIRAELERLVLPWF